MSGIQSFPNRLIAAGQVVIQAGPVAQIVGCLGIVAGITRVDVGDYRVPLRAPGVSVNLPHPALAMVSVIGPGGARFVSWQWASPTSLAVFTSDAAGEPADQAFSFLILSTERLDPRPLPAPGT